jgi:hypothetical protein
MTQETFRWIAFLATASTLIPLACFLIYKRVQPRHHMILALSLGISFIFDVIGGAMAYQQITNIVPHNIYRIIAFPAIMWFYHETLINKSLKTIVRFFTIGFLILALIFGINQGLHVTNHNTWTLSSILITITSFFFVGDLNLMADSDFAKNRFHETNIILNTSLAFYYLATIILFTLMDYVFTHFTYEDMRYFWTFHNGAHVLKNVGIGLAFHLSAKRSLALVDVQNSKQKAISIL